MNSVFGAIGAIFVLLFYNNSHAAKISCPSNISSENPKRTHTGLKGNLPLNQPILIRYENNIYRIPLGYLTWWGTPRTQKDPDGLDLTDVNDSKELAFHFWMPSLRYSEVNEMTQRHHRPCEDGRPIPPLSNYIVKIHMREPNKPYEGLIVTPTHKYKTLLKVRNKNVPEKDRYGLKLINSANTYYFRKDVYYRKDSPEIFMVCSGIKENLPNPTCHADVYYPSEEKYFTAAFPIDQIADWRKAIAASETLLNKWQLSASEGE